MTLTDADLDYLERNARKMTPGPRGCEAGEPVPGERFCVTGPTPGIPADLQDGVFGEVLMSAENHADAVVAAFLTQERVLALVAMARRAREPRCLVTGRVETTILVPEQELGLVISVNGKRYIREDEVQRSFRAVAREVGP